MLYFDPHNLVVKVLKSLEGKINVLMSEKNVVGPRVHGLIISVMGDFSESISRPYVIQIYKLTL